MNKFRQRVVKRLKEARSIPIHERQFGDKRHLGYPKRGHSVTPKQIQKLILNHKKNKHKYRKPKYCPLCSNKVNINNLETEGGC